MVATDDGCCLKCQANECYECGRRISTKPEYVVVDECSTTEPVSLSYCDGFCRGKYFWSEWGGESQCSCCNPTSTTNRAVTLQCKNGTEISYTFEDVASCGCTAACQPNDIPELPTTTTEILTKSTPAESTQPATTISQPCYWTDWINSDSPKLPYRHDNETFAHIIAAGYEICPSPQDTECRPVGGSIAEFESNKRWQAVTCDVNTGLECLGKQQNVHPACDDYEIRVYCCPTSDSSQNQIKSQSKTQSRSQAQSQLQGKSQSQSQAQSQSDITTLEDASTQHQEDSQIQNLWKKFDLSNLMLGNSHHQQQQYQQELQAKVNDLNKEVQKVGENLFFCLFQSRFS